VLPESGEHTLHVAAIGCTNQRVFLDDIELERSRPGQTTFQAPGGALLHLKPCAEMTAQKVADKIPRWNLLVNECMVEQAAPNGNGLRDLRSLPQGEYTIANGFDAGNVVQNAIRKFKFLLDGSQHEVAVAHEECVWQVSLDGKLVDQECHTLNDNAGRAEFQVVAPTGVKVPARLEMSWVLKDMKWAYHLQVGGLNVPSSWNKVKGVIEKDDNCPEILSATAGPFAQCSPLAQDAAARMFVPVHEGKERQSHQDLPQGVSYDSEAKTYQANIRCSKTKRYIPLGEFPTAELAHQKYIEALDRYRPHQKVAPSLVTQLQTQVGQRRRSSF